MCFLATGNARQTRDCNKDPCTTLPPPTTKPTQAPKIVTTPAAGCGLQPADILFIVDASGSVTAPNFQKTLTFIENMTKGLVIGPNDTQIGMVTFDTKPYLQFHLNRFTTKQQIINKVQSTQYTKGGTNTDTALKYATDTSFTPANGMRPNAAHIAIVITDGQSQNAGATAAEAKRLQDKGITVFSIGVGGGAKQSELNAIATDPDNSHVFVVTDFDSLNQIKGSLQQRACDVKPTMAAATPTQKLCGGQADIVFLLDKSGSVGQTNFDKMLTFVKNVARDFNIGPNDVQIGVDTFSTGFDHEFKLNAHGDKASLTQAVSGVSFTGGGTNTGNAIKNMRQQSFTANSGHRANVPKVAIVVTDGQSNNKALTSDEAQKARDAGITMLAIGIGSGVDDAELNSIATDPDSQNVYKASTFDALTGLQGYIAAKACDEAKPQPSANPAPSQNCGSKADIVFVLDSSGSVGANNFKLLLNFINTLVKAGNGDRPGVPNIGIIVTDGKSNNAGATKRAAENARNHGIEIFSVGVGRGISQSELKEMATDPDSSHVLTVTDFTKLNAIKSAFQAQTCQAIPPTLPPYVPTAAPAPTPGPDPCKDQIPNCAAYGQSVCTGFQAWATTNCARTCGICTPATPTVAPPCVDKLPDCPNYDATSCTGSYKPWAMENCRKYCGYCSPGTQTGGYFNKCFYKGTQYNQGDKWDDGCAYECECTDASTGQYQCYNKCPTYYNLPNKCTLVQQQGKCCLEPVCNFDGTYTTKTGQNVSDLNGNRVCVYNGRKYYQSQVWSVGCEFECICDDAGVGLYACQSKCATYGSLPSNCKLVKPPGECCEKPDCEFQTQVGTFTGRGGSSGPGVNGMNTTPPPCVDKKSDCSTYQADLCTSQTYRPFALDNCRKFCNLCNQIGVPSPTDVCIYKGQAYKQGEAWYDGCDKVCVCDNAAFGFVRCDDRCPDYLNLPQGCTLVTVPGQCCKSLNCNTPGTFTGSQTTPNTMGAVPNPYPVPQPNQYPTLPPGQTYAPGQNPNPTPVAYPTPGAGGTYAPGMNPSPTLAPGSVPSPSGGKVVVPPKLNGCVYKGVLYQQGQRWADGCDSSCMCENGNTGKYRCNP
ncbi:collagen alpha-5(VI) chain, partial [Elysia marginata]